MQPTTRATAEPSPAPERTAVYRLYDEAEQLLYVGVAVDPPVRFRQHRRDKPWWSQVNLREVEWFDDREAALKVEAEAIVRELPRHNDIGVPWPHHRLGEAPAEVMSYSMFAACLHRMVTAELPDTRRPVVITHHGAPKVVVVPYFARTDREPTEERGDLRYGD
ncbi:GIY-YIG nuclease family protein [Streptomyces cadmiisoli]|uniref:GIY-YIG nuclease family protein n=1 Tax=Streptomyces cadmiisoli TaxID=2184053 RepID=UPI003667133F